jgi:hypothetical protein
MRSKNQTNVKDIDIYNLLNMIMITKIIQSRVKGSADPDKSKGMIRLGAKEV